MAAVAWGSNVGTLRRWIGAGIEKVPLRRIWQGLLVLAFAVTTLSGGFGTAHGVVPAKTQPGRPVKSPYLTMTVDQAAVASALPWVDSRNSQGKPYPVAAPPGAEFVVVATHMTNLWKSSQYNLDQYLSLHGVKGVPDKAGAKVVYQRGDATPYSPAEVVLQPKLTTEVAFAWPVPAGSVRPGDRVDVVINTMDRLENTKIGYGGTFLPPYPFATLTIPVGAVR
mgnify:FL=1